MSYTKESHNASEPHPAKNILMIYGVSKVAYQRQGSSRRYQEISPDVKVMRNLIVYVFTSPNLCSWTSD